jgi:subtilisin family serine protease
MRQLLKTLFAVNMFLAGIVLVMCLILLLVRSAHAEPTVKQNAAKIHYNKKTKIIKVMVIDTGIDGTIPILRHYMPEARPYSKADGAHLPDYTDQFGHGTHITGLILFGKFYPSEKLGHWKVRHEDIMCDNVQIYSCKYYHTKVGEEVDVIDNAKSTMDCLVRAYKQKMNVVNYSSGGYQPYKVEYDLIRLLGNNHHTIMTTAMGNENSDIKLRPYFPAGYTTKYDMTEDYKPLPNIIAVGALAKDGKKKHWASNYGLDVPKEIGEDVVSTMPMGKMVINGMGVQSGTSQATAIYLHRLLIEKCKEINK